MDLINRQAAIEDVKSWGVINRYEEQVRRSIIEWLEDFPSAQPYNAEEIQKMQELESVQMEKVYELGRESAQSELDPEALIRTIEMGIAATNLNDIYSIGMCNGMRWCKSLIDSVEPKFEGYVMSVDDWKELPSIQTEPYRGEVKSDNN